ncbi:MAG: PspA/IM30 family protein [Rhizobiales bacterium]|nr:PspA/IM30 family protein [Hyphomicrobiales bacterium]
MIKQLFALIRGNANQATENYTDKHGLTILRQQINDAASAVQTARKSVAIAVAQNKQEEEQFKVVSKKIDDLEERAIIALEKGKKQIAQEAAESIALLEGERDISKQSQQRFSAEISKLKAQLHSAETRLRALKQGHRIADVTEKTQRMRGVGAASAVSTLNDAENTLSRLRTRQKQIDATSEAMSEMDQSTNSDAIAQKLADAGCGEPLKKSASDVLERLNKRVKKST